MAVNNRLDFGLAGVDVEQRPDGTVKHLLHIQAQAKIGRIHLDAGPNHVDVDRRLS